jgi:hypothetical protein
MLILAGLVWELRFSSSAPSSGYRLRRAVLGSGPQITHMAAMAGWGTFLIEHLLYGLGMGVLMAVFARRTSPASA